MELVQQSIRRSVSAMFRNEIQRERIPTPKRPGVKRLHWANGRAIPLRTQTVLVAIALVHIIRCQASWICWESGFREDSGKAVISVEGSPFVTGLSQVYHFNRINFEAAVDWRSGDVLEVRADESEQWVYTLKRDAHQPLQLDIRLTHRLGPGEVESVEGMTELAQAWALVGDLGQTGRLSYSLQLYQGDEEIRYTDASGISYEESGMTFQVKPEMEVMEGVELLDVSLSGIPTGAPKASATQSSAICAASFGNDGPVWDRLTITFSDNTGSGVIPAGTQMRIILAGAPLGRSDHLMPCQTRPLMPFVLADSERPQIFPVSEITCLSETGQVTCYAPESPGPLLAPFSAVTKDWEPQLKFPLRFLENPSLTSPELINVVVQSDGYTNVQPSQVAAFDEMKVVPLEALLSGAWNRHPPDWGDHRPPGRPLWESSISLSKGFPLGEGSFRARSLNARRMLGGSTNGKPAVWWQRESEPHILSDRPGSVAALNDALRPLAVGQCEFDDGRLLPQAWQQGATGWQPMALPVPSFTISGSALAANERGLICGYADVLMTGSSNRIPCVWRSGSLEVLPVPDGSIRAEPLDLNADGVLVGYTEDGEGLRTACRWAVSEGKWTHQSLEFDGTAKAINAFGLIVGNADDEGILWQNGERFQLSALSDTPIADSVGMTDLADIVAITKDDRTVLLHPVTPMNR